VQIEDDWERPGRVWGTQDPDRQATQRPGGHVDVTDVGLGLRDVTGLDIVENRATLHERELEEKRRTCGRVCEFLCGALKDGHRDLLHI
jgi:hypothetical protein